MPARKASSAHPQRRRGSAAPRPANADTAPPPPATVTRRDWRNAILLVTLLWAGLFFPHLFLGQRVVMGDSSYYRPFAEFSRERWHESRERTYWNPYVFMGIESVASFADPRPQYLPAPLLDLTEKLHEPGPSPQLWPLLAHLGGALAVMALVRRLWGTDAWSAAVGATAWLFAVPLLGPFAHGFDAQFVTATLMPLALLGTQVLLTAAPRRWAALGGLGLAATLALQSLHGHPQILIYSSMLALAFALQQAVEHRRYGRLLAWVGAIGLGTAMGAAVWYPAWLYSAESSRSGLEGSGVPMAVVAKYSYAWRDLLSLIWAQAVGFGRETYWGGMQVEDNAPYLGAAAAALALSGRAGARANATTWFWRSVFLAGAILALGATLGGVFTVLHGVIPFWSRFRAASYVIVWSALGLAMLAGRGTWLASMPRASAVTSEPHGARAVAVLLAGFALVGLIIAFGPLRDLYVQYALGARVGLEPAAAARAARWAGLGLVAITSLVAITRAVIAQIRAGRAWARPALALIVALDLGAVIAPALWRATGPRSAVEAPPPTPLARTAARTPHTRVYVGASQPVQAPQLATGRYSEAYTNFWISWRVRALVGSIGAYPGAWGPVIQSGLTRSAAALKAWGVQWYDTDSAPPAGADANGAAPGDARKVEALAGAPGRVYAVPLVVPFADRGGLVAAMQHADFDPTLAAVTLDAAAGGEYPGAQTCSIRWVRDDPEWLEFEIGADDRAFVVVADSHAPGWSATLDGAPVPITPVDLMVRGVAVPAGRHRLVMTHSTPGAASGTRSTRIAGGVWILLAIGLAVSCLPRRSPQRAG